MRRYDAHERCQFSGSGTGITRCFAPNDLDIQRASGIIKLNKIKGGFFMKHFDTFGVMLDCSRNAVMTVKELKHFIAEYDTSSQDFGEPF